MASDSSDSSSSSSSSDDSICSSADEDSDSGQESLPGNKKKRYVYGGGLYASFVVAKSPSPRPKKVKEKKVKPLLENGVDYPDLDDSYFRCKAKEYKMTRKFI